MGLSICGTFWDQNQTSLLAKKIEMLDIIETFCIVFCEKNRLSRKLYYRSKNRKSLRYYYRRDSRTKSTFEGGSWGEIEILWRIWLQNHIWLSAKQVDKVARFYRRDLRKILGGGGGSWVFVVRFGIKITVDYQPKKSKKCLIICGNFWDQNRNQLPAKIL